AWRRAVLLRRVDLLADGAYTLLQYYEMQGRFQESADACQDALAAVEKVAQNPVSAQTRAFFLTMQGWNFIRLGRFDEAQQLFNESHAFWQQTATQPPPGFGTDPANGLALVAHLNGNYATAIALADDACQRHSASADWLNAQIGRHILAGAHFALGNYAASRSHAQEGYGLSKAGGNRWMVSYMLNFLGEVSRVLGEYEEARQYYQQCYFVRQEFAGCGRERGGLRPGRDGGVAQPARQDGLAARRLCGSRAALPA
ncbi:MAG TPA: hypothetical protein PKE45_02310, partial [Caldilineaceae bacterium]|nr:hypothetical protein [Caldilineaceae bacterium]